MFKYSQLKERKYSFERRLNPLRTYMNNRVLLVRKLKKEEKNSKEISKEVDDFFGSPEKYFQKNSPFTIGKKINIFDINESHPRRPNKLKTEKKNGINLFNHLSNFVQRNSYNSGLFNSLLNQERKKSTFKTKFELIDNDRLKMIFDSYKNTDNNFTNNNSLENDQSPRSDTNNITFMRNAYLEQRKKYIQRNTINFDINKQPQDNIPNDIKQRLNMQTRKLKSLKKSEIKNNKMAKYLSRKANKPQDNLLLNRIDSFRYKKEMIKEIEFNKTTDEKLGKYIWNLSLRRPPHFRGIRKAYVNLNSEKYSPFWSLIIEKCPKQRNVSVKPEYNLSEGEKYEFNKQSINLKQDNLNDNQKTYFQTIENLDSVIVKGKNLFNLEYKREIIDSKKNKVWHKAFKDNGKTLTLSEINKLYGNETFYKDYNGYSTEKNMQSKLKSVNFQ